MSMIFHNQECSNMAEFTFPLSGYVKPDWFHILASSLYDIPEMIGINGVCRALYLNRQSFWILDIMEWLRKRRLTGVCITRDTYQFWVDLVNNDFYPHFRSDITIEKSRRTRKLSTDFLIEGLLSRLRTAKTFLQHFHEKLLTTETSKHKIEPVPNFQIGKQRPLQGTDFIRFELWRNI